VACNYRRPNIPCGRFQTLEQLAQWRRRLSLSTHSLVGGNISVLMFLFLDISIVFLCLLYFPVDLEVIYLGHIKKSLYRTIQYRVSFWKLNCGNRVCDFWILKSVAFGFGKLIMSDIFIGFCTPVLMFIEEPSDWQSIVVNIVINYWRLLSICACVCNAHVSYTFLSRMLLLLSWQAHLPIWGGRCPEVMRNSTVFT